ncbi:MAG TPA: sugar transferase [Nocardioidaceae bacterium]|nr:sugar transferase [Nocardioidaceae bacterium]
MGLSCALVVAVVLGAPTIAAAAAVAWGVLSAVNSDGARPSSSLSARLTADVRCAVVVCSVVSLVSVLGASTAAHARWGIAVVVVATAATAAVRFVASRAVEARRIVVVGSQRDIDCYLASSRGSDVVIVGQYVVDAGPALAVDRVPTITAVEALDELVSSVVADTVLVIPGDGADATFVRRLTWRLEHSAATVAVLAPLSSVSLHRLATSQLGGRTVLELAPAGSSALQAGVKGLLDRLVAALALLFLSPLLVALVVAVRVDSKGSGMFVQARVGKDGRVFPMFKLRTMYADAEAMKQALLEDNECDGVLFKIRRDPRVTRVGYWLRRSSLDELPQLWNVVRGEMSLVGPRPALPSEVTAYDSDARRRLAVKPGITGLWQVSGRSDLSWDESLRLDLHYVDNWRLVDDLSIAVRTVGAVVEARGAY